MSRLLATGLDRLLADPRRLAGRRYGLLAHGASLTADLRPAHRALAASPAGAPAVLFGPEHGYYGVEQDMVAAQSAPDPWTGIPIVSLYGDAAASLVPDAAAVAGLDLLVVDLQDVGARYYTYAATAVWAALVAIGAGCEVWFLDRPNPLGGERVEGNLPEPGFDSFVGAFRTPVCHGLTLGELALLEARRRGLRDGLTIWTMEGWTRATTWEETGRPFVAPSPNMPSATTAQLYPGGCLVEATELSEGRGTTRPFQLAGAPGVEPTAVADRLAARGLPGVAFVPTYFRPQFQKHAGRICGGVELAVTAAPRLAAYRTGVELLAAFRAAAPEAFAWRRAAYEFVAEIPAIDLLARTVRCRQAIDSGDAADLADWMASWAADEAEFRRECEEILLYR